MPNPALPGGHVSSGPLRAAYDTLICDLDGVVYRGDSAVPGAPATLRQLRAHGMRVVFATNNASRVPADTAAQLTGLGIPTAASDIVTSAQAGAAELTTLVSKGARVLALGGEGVAEALSDEGFQAVLPGTTDAAEPVDAILQGLGRDLRVRDFEEAARHLNDGAVWVASNGDTTFPLEWGLAPGNGAYVQLLEMAARRSPVVVGKPHAPLYRAALDRVGARPESTLAVGDRLDTDIAGAVAAGIDSAWVLTGVDAPSALLRGHEDALPTWLIGSLAELDEPYAAVSPTAEGWTCAGGRVAVGPGGLEVAAGGARPIELVRAGVAAVMAVIRETEGHALDLETLGRELDDLLS